MKINNKKYLEFLSSKDIEYKNSGFSIEEKDINSMLYDFQAAILKWSLIKGKAAIFADCGLGKGQPLDSKVLLISGWKKIQDLKLGDRAVSSDGRAYPIVGIYPKEEIDTYRFYFSDGSSFVTDIDHLHIVRTDNDRQRGKKWRVLSTKELISISNLKYGKDKGHRNYDIPIVSPIEFSKKKLPISPYVLGVLLGDGYICGGVWISKSDRDIEIIDKVGELLGNKYNILKKNDNEIDRRITYIENNKNPLIDSLRKLDLFGRHSYDKFIPKKYLFSDINDRLELLRGLLDTDGYIKNTTQYYTTSKQLACDVLFLIRSLGGVPTIKEKENPKYIYNGESRYGRTCYTLTFSLKTFNPFYLKRKAKLWNSNPRDNGRWIDKIEYEKRQKTICISVDSPDSSYVTENCIVTHNTPLQLEWAKNINFKTNKPVLIFAPLAVSKQTKREGKKFGIRVNICRTNRDVVNGVNITNYEMLKHFKNDNLGGIVLDECFVGNTPIDTPNGIINIEDIQPGDYVYNCIGEDRVKAKKINYCDDLVVTSIQGKNIISSENHLFFTKRGWVKAKELKKGDYIVTTRESMSLLWKNSFDEKREEVLQQNMSEQITDKVPNDKDMRMVWKRNDNKKLYKKEQTFLQSLLLSEMEDVSTGDKKESTHKGGTCKDRKKGESLVEIRRSKSKENDRKNAFSRSHEGPGYKKESIQYFEKDKTQTQDTGGKWEGDTCSSEDSKECLRGQLGIRSSCGIREKTNGISNELQNRCSKQNAKDRGRGRRFFTCGFETKSTRSEKNEEIKGIRVDNVTIYKQTDTRFDRYRDCTGRIPLYDLEIEKHPSFSIHNFLVHNSSILKGFDGAFKRDIIDFARSIPFRSAYTATPSPNDLVEIINHAEFLGIMKEKEIKALFFTNRSQDIVQKWVLKEHAKKDFWKWLASWSVALRMPSDIGYENGKFVLPKLNERNIIVKSDNESRKIKRISDKLIVKTFFEREARSLKELQEVRKNSINDRVKECSEMVNKSDEQWLIWCDLNEESRRLKESIPGSVEVKGSDSNDHKETAMLDFQDKKIRVLITKPSIAGHGMNWQNCYNMAFVGLSHSFEKKYQATRRCWRFGQENEVNSYSIIDEMEIVILKNLERKEKEAEELFRNIIKNMNLEGQLSARREEMVYMEEMEKGKGWELYLGDSVLSIDKIKSESIGLSIFSPPFPGMYVYTNSKHDIGNTKSIEELIDQFRFLVCKDKLYRITMPGRHCCIHLTQGVAFKSKDGYIGIKDFRGKVIQMMEDEGWIYYGEVCIDKDPQVRAIRTKDRGLLFKTLSKDSSLMHPALADYLLQFTKPGDNPSPIPAGISKKYNDEKGWITTDEWIEWAAPVWYRQTSHYPGGIRETDVLKYKNAKDEKDEKHLAPLQLGVIERAIKMWTAPGDIVYSPFAGIGSEGYVALQLDRKFIGGELKKSYFDIAVKNLKSVAKRSTYLNLFQGTPIKKDVKI